MSFGIEEAAACAASKVPGTRPEDVEFIEAGHSYDTELLGTFYSHRGKGD